MAGCIVVRMRGLFWLFLSALLVHAADCVSESCPTYYVNLDRSPDRRDRMERLFSTFSHFKRVKGVDGHDRKYVKDTLAPRCSFEELPRSFDEQNLGVKKVRRPSTLLSYYSSRKAPPTGSSFICVHLHFIIRSPSDGYCFGASTA